MRLLILLFLSLSLLRRRLLSIAMKRQQPDFDVFYSRGDAMYSRLCEAATIKAFHLCVGPEGKVRSRRVQQLHRLRSALAKRSPAVHSIHSIHSIRGAALEDRRATKGNQSLPLAFEQMRHSATRDQKTH